MQPRLVSEYVEPGLVRLEYRDYAFRGPEAVRAAEAAACAAEQRAFWPYSNAVRMKREGLVALGQDLTLGDEPSLIPFSVTESDIAPYHRNPTFYPELVGKFEAGRLVLCPVYSWQGYGQACIDDNAVAVLEPVAETPT